MRTTIRWVRYSVLRVPVLIVESNDLVLPGFEAFNAGMVVFVRPRAWANEALIQHELTHTQQLIRSAGLYAILQAVSRSARLRGEAEAYLAQLSAAPEPERTELRKRLATVLATRYNLGISYRRALMLLRGDQYGGTVDGDGPVQEG